VPELETKHARGWHEIVTLDDSGIYFSIDCERIWRASEEPVPDKVRHMTQPPILIITVAWSFSGFHGANTFPKELKFNAGYYTREILHKINNWREQQGVNSFEKLSVHADNTRLHTAKLSTDFLEANNIRKAFLSSVLAWLGTI
jgi:hypothetical protein